MYLLNQKEEAGVCIIDMPIPVTIEGDISQLPVVTPERARAWIEDENADRFDDAVAASGGYDDDFYYRKPKFHLLRTEKQGEFVSSITYCGEGGIGYDLHARVEA